ncbi:MAG: alpha/beta fold hydrolase [Candidatus Abyssobacteria bacterium SURF_5]|uniref:Alpha/beta fold hydrolase n=1 Tax=Abyssobacteria bacterium (strain SURF_5) TaxID=2093360 RepID=A0A3A4NR23_ABYX5|nr:MAG: alpha/beta fold hydrolase [Candidatus Abyssubacteria bacterium SURF_5]
MPFFSHYQELVEALSRETKLLLFDNRGAGRSDKPDCEYTMAMLADDAAGLLNYLDIEHTNILGASMGGMIAQEFALRHPAKTDAAILCCTSPGSHRMIPPSAEVLETLSTVDGLSDEEITRKNWPLSFTKTFMENNRNWLEEKMRREIAYSAPAFSFKRQMAAAMMHNSYSRLPEIACPVLVLTGAEDILIPPENSDLLASQIPNSVLKRYAGVGHGFMTEERDAVVKDVLEFVSGHCL